MNASQSILTRGRPKSHIRPMNLLALLFLSVTVTGLAFASQPNLPPGGNYTSIAAAPFGGFWVQVDDGSRTGTYAVDGAPQYGTVDQPGSIAAFPALAPGGQGYWIVTLSGQIHNRGFAQPLCDGYLPNCSGFYPSGRHIVAAAASPDRKGLWAVDNRGAVWTAGQTVSYGDVTNEIHPPTAIVATPSGNGYYILIADGGVYSFGDAVFYGSTGGNRPGGHDLTGMALCYNRDGQVIGYWLVSSDGGVSSFGQAPFLGSTGGAPGRGAISNITTRPDGRSYAWVYKDGGVTLSRTVPTVHIGSVKSPNTLLTIADERRDVGAPLALDPPNTSFIQKWDLWPADSDGDVVQLRNVSTGLCADALLELPDTTVIQYPCKGANEGWNNQRWRLVQNASGHTLLQSALHPGSVIVGEVNGAGSTVKLVPTPQVSDPLTAEWTITQVQ